MKLEFWGSSDDLVEVEGDFREEYGAWGGGDVGHKASFAIVGEYGQARVHAIYDGCWSFALGQVDEDIEIPGYWTYAIGQKHGYSSFLAIDTGSEKVGVVREEKA